METICYVFNVGLNHSCCEMRNFSIFPCSGKDHVTDLTPDDLQTNPRYTKCSYPEACYRPKVSSTSVSLSGNARNLQRCEVAIFFILPCIYLGMTSGV